MVSSTVFQIISSILFAAVFFPWPIEAQTNSSKSEAFVQCFLAYHHDQGSSDDGSSQIFSPNSNASSFDTIYRSTIRDLLFLSPNSTKPSLIVLPTNTSHAQAAVSCGKKLGLRLRVRSGGHDYEGLSYVSSGDPFVLLDIANFRSVQVNSTDGTAWVGAGATVGEVAYYISLNNGTAGFPAGICTTLGFGGHLSGGGIGTLMRKYGTSADNVVDAVMVDVNGRILNRESMGEDLFWAIRGGGAASFGVILSYKIKLVYIPPKVTVFNIARTLKNDATQLVEKWQSAASEFNEDLWIRNYAQAISDQGSPTIQVTFQGMFLGRTSDLLSTLNYSFPELGVRAQDCSELSWAQSVLYFAGYPVQNLTMLLDRFPQSEAFFKAKSDFVRNPINETGWESIWKMMLQSSGEEPLVMIMEPWGGKMYTIPENAIAFPHRKGNLFNIQHYLSWTESDEAVATRHLDWMRKFYDFMTPYVSKNPRAAYLNYKDLDLGQNEPAGEASYADARVWGEKYYLENFMKLAQVKARVDPENYFWNEQSIPPYTTSFFSSHFIYFSVIV